MKKLVIGLLGLSTLVCAAGWFDSYVILNHGEVRKVITPANNKDAYVEEFTWNGHQYLLVTFDGEAGGAVCPVVEDNKMEVK